MVAFCSKVVPVSGGAGRPRSAADRISTPKRPSMPRISPALPRLWVATTSLGKVKRRAIRRPHPEEWSAGPRLDHRGVFSAAWSATDAVLVPILRDAALCAAPRDEVSAVLPFLLSSCRSLAAAGA